jgi:hypothetical protein
MHRSGLSCKWLVRLELREERVKVFARSTPRRRHQSFNQSHQSINRLPIVRYLVRPPAPANPECSSTSLIAVCNNQVLSQSEVLEVSAGRLRCHNLELHSCVGRNHRQTKQLQFPPGRPNRGNGSLPPLHFLQINQSLFSILFSTTSSSVLTAGPELSSSARSPGNKSSHLEL